MDMLGQVMIQADTFLYHFILLLNLCQTVLHRFVSALGGAVSNSAVKCDLFKI